MLGVFFILRAMYSTSTELWILRIFLLNLLPTEPKGVVFTAVMCVKTSSPICTVS